MSTGRCPRCGYQLLPGETECPKCRGAGASPPTASAGPPRTSGLAVAALVVGILGLCGGLLAIPGLILGIAALVKVNRSEGRLAGRGLAWSAIGLSMFGIFLSFMTLAVLFPVFARAREAARIQGCQANAAQLTLGALSYAQDHGDRLPPADTWSDDILPYVEGRRVFTCPTARGAQPAYAYNRALGEWSLGEIADPQRTVLIFESEAGWNGAGGPEALVERHIVGSGKGSVVGFVDGQVERIASEQLPELVWEPGGAPAFMR